MKPPAGIDTAPDVDSTTDVGQRVTADPAAMAAGLPGSWLILFGFAAALIGAELIAPFVFITLTGYLPDAVYVTTAVATTLVGLPLLYFFVRLGVRARAEATRANQTERRLRRLTHYHRAISAINQLIARRTDLDTLWRDTCKLLVEEMHMGIACIGLWRPETGELHVQAVSGDVPSGMAPGARLVDGWAVDLARRAPDEPGAARPAGSASVPSDAAFTLCRSHEGAVVLVVRLPPRYLDDPRFLDLFAGIRHDIAYAMENAERDLSLELNRRAVQSSADAIVVLDRRWRIVSSNPAFERLSGAEPGALLGQRAYLLLPASRRRTTLRSMTRALQTYGRWRGETWLGANDGELRPLAGSVASVTGDASAEAYYVAVFQDVGEQRELERQVRHLAYHDALTGLANRHRVDEYLRGLFARGTRIGLLFIDIDHFKRINDAQGHSIGDRLLQAVARRLQGLVHHGELVARIGGDEFAVITYDTERGAVGSLGERLVDVLGSQPYAVDGAEIRVTASVAATLFPDDGDCIEVLRQNVDRALRHAKTGGRNRCVVFEGWMRERAEQQLSIERDLRAALAAQDQLEMHYQPVLASDDGRLLGAEALIRWRHPELGLLVADQFMPTAEAVGMMREIDTWVLDAVLRQLREWERLGLETGWIAINLSAAHCSDQTYPARVASLIERSGLRDRGRLSFEILENVLLDDSPAQHQVLAALRRHGHRLILDDWGRGYARLHYLSQVGVDAVKIDKSFVQQLPGDPRSLAAVKTVLQLGRELGIDVIAEGVENADQRGCLRELGCPGLQGYFVAPVMHAADLAEWLAKVYPRSGDRVG